MIRSVFCRVAVLACAVLLAPTAALPQAANAPDLQGRLQAQSGYRFAQVRLAQTQLAQIQLAQAQLTQGVPAADRTICDPGHGVAALTTGPRQGYSLSNGIFPCHDQYGTRGYCFNVFLPC